MEQVRSLMGLSLKFFVPQVFSVIIYFAINIIISQTQNPEQVAVYNVGYRYFSIPITIALIFAAPLWSAFTDAFTKKDRVWMKNTNRRIDKLFLILSVFTLLLYFISSPVFELWVGEKITVPGKVSFAFLFYTILIIYQSLKIQIINGVGKINIQILITSILGIIFIPLSLIAGKYFALSGIIYALCFVYLVIDVLVCFQTEKLINGTAKGIWNR
jgi:O-antigen/teichoic acid export membrane protein